VRGRAFLRAVRAEALKQHRTYFHSPLVYFSFLVWPVLEIAIARYMYSPFADSGEPALARAVGTDSATLFIFLGYVGYVFFFSMVQSAWRFTWERFYGTLEVAFLSPVNRFALVLGNALSSLVESVWMFAVLSVAALYMFQGGTSPAPLRMILSLLAMVVAAVAWGTLLNTLFLFTRDAGVFFTVLQDPMNFFSGVRVPITAFPPWLRAVSYAFPLTFALNIMRGSVLEGRGFYECLPPVACLAASIAVMLALSYALVGLAERLSKERGTLSQF